MRSSGRMPFMGDIAPCKTWYSPENAPVPFEGGHVHRLLYHADSGSVTARVLAEAAWVGLGDVGAGGAEDDPLLDGENGFGERARVLVPHSYEVVRQSLGRLWTDPRQFMKLFDELPDWV